MGDRVGRHQFDHVGGERTLPPLQRVWVKLHYCQLHHTTLLYHSLC